METQTQKHNIASQSEVALIVNRLGDSEYRLALLRCGPGATVKQLVDFIEDWRKQFIAQAGVIADSGSAIMASADTWVKIARASGDAAQRELAKSSAAVRKLDALELAAKEAQEKADKAQAELRATIEALDAIQAQVDQLNKRARRCLVWLIV